MHQLAGLDVESLGVPVVWPDADDRERSGEPITVGVPWGALHMTAVAGRLFSELGYRVVAADWLTVRNAR
ncbi:hypothetical protein GCM10010466_26470 [Planomonospora alba]|uniref:Uncharacterized protein n=1 Tax=Planomonospora alba TaxID=161354 RepID=A0ABP6N2J2_9ACTN